MKKADHIITDPIEALQDRIEYCKYRINKIIEMQKRPRKKFLEHFNNDMNAFLRATNNYIAKYELAIKNISIAIIHLKNSTLLEINKGVGIYHEKDGLEKGGTCYITVSFLFHKKFFKFDCNSLTDRLAVMADARAYIDKLI